MDQFTNYILWNPLQKELLKVIGFSLFLPKIVIRIYVYNIYIFYYLLYNLLDLFTIRNTILKIISLYLYNTTIKYKIPIGF